MCIYLRQAIVVDTKEFEPPEVLNEGYRHWYVCLSVGSMSGSVEMFGSLVR